MLNNIFTPQDQYMSFTSFYTEKSINLDFPERFYLFLVSQMQKYIKLSDSAHLMLASYLSYSYQALSEKCYLLLFAL